LLLLFSAGAAWPCNSPLILDLNDDGIHTWRVDYPVLFDIDGDGSLDRTAWTDPGTDEGILWLDLNHNGVPDSGRELFGTATLLDRGQLARDGFEALRMYDGRDYGGNRDGVISGADLVFWELRLWVDFDHNGRSGLGESYPLWTRGVLQLSLDYRTVEEYDPSWNLHLLQGTFDRWVVRRFGPPYRRTQAMHDVFFQEAE
jgi:hypothetical protein